MKAAERLLVFVSIVGIMILALRSIHLDPSGSIPSHPAPHTIVLVPHSFTRTWAATT